MNTSCGFSLPFFFRKTLKINCRHCCPSDCVFKNCQNCRAKSKKLVLKTDCNCPNFCSAFTCNMFVKFRRNRRRRNYFTCPKILSTLKFSGHAHMSLRIGDKKNMFGCFTLHYSERQVTVNASKTILFFHFELEN